MAEQEKIPSNQEKIISEKSAQNIGMFAVGELVASPEKQQSRKIMFEDAVVGYAEYLLFEEDFDSIKKYIDINDVCDLYDLKEKEGVTQQEKNEALIDIHDKCTDYQERGIFPDNKCHGDELRALSAILKTEYAMNFNDAMRNIIFNQKENERITLNSVRNALNVTFINVTTDKQTNRYNRLDLENRFGNEQKMVDDMMLSLEGMRHEIGFKELFSNVDFMNIIPSYSKDDDAKGIDMRLNVKISKYLDNHGKWKIADNSEIQEGDYHDVILPVDIKSSQNAAYRAIDTKCNRDGAYYHWALWSQIDKMDFCLGVSKNGEDFDCPCYKLDANYAPILLRQDTQIAAINKFGGKDINYSNLKNTNFGPRGTSRESTSNSNRHYIENGKKHYVVSSYQDRLNSLKRTITDGVNAMYGVEQSESV